jgi:hypothetical protein
VQAENAKSAWKERDQETQERYRKLALSAVAAARLAKQIATWFPPPWNDDSPAAAFRPLVVSLVEYAICGFHESSQVDRDVATRLARAMLDCFYDDLRAAGKRISAELVGELVWLALGRGREHPFRESTIRRYGRDATLTLPAAEVWRNSFKLMVEVARLVPDAQRSTAFADAMHSFLQPPRHH